MAILTHLVSDHFFSPISLFLFVFAAFLVYTLSVITYRLYFHPLAKYPGPLLAKLTDCYLAYHAWKGDRHLEFYRCHEKYGRFVRIGPNLLSINSKTALKSIYGFKSNVRKSDFYTAFWANKSAFNVHNVIDKHIHARKRRVLSHAFADGAIKSMEKYILANIETACHVLRSQPQGEKEEVQQMDLLSVRHVGSETPREDDGWTAPINIANWCDWLTFDIMGDLAFGKAFGMLDHPQNRFAVDLVSSAAHRHLICGTHLPIHTFHLDKLLFPSIAGKRATYMQYSRAQSLERTKAGLDVDRKDFFYYLLNARDPETGHGFSPAELWGESNLLIIAGSDTTSTAMAGTFFYLTHNPSSLAKAAAEIRSTFESVEEIVQGPRLSGCTYLRACIDEAMRLSPPVGGGLPRTVLSGGLHISHPDTGDTFIPAGTDVLVPHYTLHHNSAYFPYPHSYIPERWLSNHPDCSTALAAKVDDAHAAFCPFSIGPRGCIGKGLAYVELMSTIARVLWLFDVRLLPGTHVGEGHERLEYPRWSPGEYQLKDTFTSMKDGPMVQFRPRDS